MVETLHATSLLCQDDQRTRPGATFTNLIDLAAPAINDAQVG